MIKMATSCSKMGDVIVTWTDCHTLHTYDLLISAQMKDWKWICHANQVRSHLSIGYVGLRQIPKRSSHKPCGILAVTERMFNFDAHKVTHCMRVSKGAVFSFYSLACILRGREVSLKSFKDTSALAWIMQIGCFHVIDLPGHVGKYKVTLETDREKSVQ